MTLDDKVQVAVEECMAVLHLEGFPRHDSSDAGCIYCMSPSYRKDFPQWELRRVRRTGDGGTHDLVTVMRWVRRDADGGRVGAEVGAWHERDWPSAVKVYAQLIAAEALEEVLAPFREQEETHAGSETTKPAP